MWMVIATILGLFLSAVVIFIINMEDVHAGRTNTDCCLSFKQFKSFYSLNPEKWHVGSGSLGYDAHGFVFAQDDELTVLDVDYRTLAAECITDIRRDLDAWAAFMYSDSNPEVLQKRKDDILWLCDTMEDQYVR